MLDYDPHASHENNSLTNSVDRITHAAFCSWCNLYFMSENKTKKWEKGFNTCWNVYL